MIKIWATAVFTWVSLSIGNYTFQILSNSKWDVALERSYFQAIAVVLFAVALSFLERAMRNRIA